MNFFKLLPLAAVIATAGLTSSIGYALTVGDLVVKSKIGEPFNAEVNVFDVEGNPPTVMAQMLPMASSSYAMRKLISEMAYAVEITSGNQGVIKLTSKTPLSEVSVNGLLRVTSLGNIRLKEVHGTVEPNQVMVQPLADLPAPAVVNTPSAPVELVASSVNSTVATAVARADLQSDVVSTPAHSEIPLSSAETALQPLHDEPPPMDFGSVAPLATIGQATVMPEKSIDQEPTKQRDTLRQAKKQTTVKQRNRGSYQVKNADSLWLIASRLSSQNQKSIRDNMDLLFENNPDAFVDGDRDRLRSNVKLIVRSGQMSRSPHVAKKRVQRPLAMTARSNINNARRSGNLPTSKPEMKLVSPNTNGSAQGKDNTNEQSKSMLSNNTSNVDSALVAKIQSARTNNFGLRSKVSQLTADVGTNERKITLLNAQLATIEAQLKQRKSAKVNTSTNVGNQTDKSS